MSSLVLELAAVLGTVRRPGDFFASGTAELLAPMMEVAGVGPIALPLLPVQAEQLIAVAERAPYGRGEETLVDPAVRRTWQIDAGRVHIGGRHWPRTLERIVARAAEGLGVDGPVEAALYKLLIYAEGDFFVRHRDTEKVPGMFATLVIVLPSVPASTGGELIVRHKGREVRLDLRSEEPSEVRFAAFYADCVHELTPVTQGHRLTLVYNLTRPGPVPLPEPPDYDRETARAATLLKDWAEAAGEFEDDILEDDSLVDDSLVDARPEKLIYPLEHAYTPAELDFGALKGADAAVAGVLAAAARRADCALHLALVSIEESGIAEYTGDGGAYRSRWSEPELEALEVTDRRAVLTQWRRPDGGSASLADIPFGDDELLPPDAFDGLEPDEEHFHEATGNEGASFERTYRRAALVLWPNARFLAVLNQAGLSVTLPYLEGLTRCWEDAGGVPSSPLWEQGHELAGHIIGNWAERYGGHDETPGPATRLLTALTRLADTESIAAFLDRLAEGGEFAKGDTGAMVEAAGLLAPERTATLIERIIRAKASSSLEACAALLARAAAALPLSTRTSFAGAAEALLAALPGDPTRADSQYPWWNRPRPPSAGLVADVLIALGRIDEALAMRAADHMLAWPKTYDLDVVLIPAVVDLVGTRSAKSLPAVERLRATALTHLRTRIAEPLEAPKDWRRNSQLPCSCPDCRDLTRFLDDPAQKTWTLKAAEARRGHVETMIRQAGSDLDVATDRKGRPYTLVCTKNQASYERRVKQRQRDLETVARLEA
jgi:predicted 2-oxoglutarate/Fe(II)-dependent dioxygenase YbiX